MAVDNAFLRPDQLTPVSSSTDSRNVSPRTPLDGRRSPFGKPIHKIINGPPSPEIYSSNLDNAFPPFPTARRAGSRNPPPHINTSSSTEKRMEPRYAEADPRYAPMSPANVGTGQLLQRMNSIAPGPFDINGPRPPSRAQTMPRPHTANSAISEEATKKTHMPQDSSTSSIHTRSSIASSTGGRPIFSGASLSKTGRPAGYGGFGRPADQTEKVEPEQPTIESQISTSPIIPGSQSHTPAGTSFAPRDRLEARQPQAQENALSTRQPLATQLMGKQDLSLPRGSNLGDDFGTGNPYHTPNLSQSSNGSERSGVSPGSSQSSPPSDADRGRYTSDNIPKPTPQPQIDISSSIPLKPSPLIREQFANPMPAAATTQLDPESPMDPSMKEGRLSPVPPRSEMRPVLNRAATAPAARRPTTSKGNCKGCGEPIKGKSVSSADGRLTGRYHKQCFVCKTCRQPFATATFYVIDDAPYCERHYHQLNNSLCRTCDKGIEGQYLETERKTKHHPHCLACSDCRRVLKDGYFEMNGRVYCERDASKRAQQRSLLGPGMTNRMEKRSTRLMNI